MVAEFAIHLALSQGKKAFYTTPIKALSNQKYTDLVAVYGQESRLAHRDTSRNPEAQIVVMTTEVLRNMLTLTNALETWDTWLWMKCTIWPTVPGAVGRSHHPLTRIRTAGRPVGYCIEC